MRTQEREPDPIQLRVFAENDTRVVLGHATFFAQELLTIRNLDVVLVDRWTKQDALAEGKRVVMRMDDAVALRGVLVEVEGEIGFLVQAVLLQ